MPVLFFDDRVVTYSSCKRDFLEKEMGLLDVGNQSYSINHALKVSALLL